MIKRSISFSWSYPWLLSHDVYYPEKHFLLQWNISLNINIRIPLCLNVLCCLQTSGVPGFCLVFIFSSLSWAESGYSGTTQLSHAHLLRLLLHPLPGQRVHHEAGDEMVSVRWIKSVVYLKCWLNLIKWLIVETLWLPLRGNYFFTDPFRSLVKTFLLYFHLNGGAKLTKKQCGCQDGHWNIDWGESDVR